VAKSAAAARQQQRRLLPKETVLSVTRAERRADPQGKGLYETKLSMISILGFQGFGADRNIPQSSGT